MKITSTVFMIIFAVSISSCKSITTKQDTIASKEAAVDTVPGSCANLATDSRNNIVLSWIRHPDTLTNIFCYAVSTDEGKTFGPPVEIPGSTNVQPHGENMPKLVFKPSGEIIAAWGVANPNAHNRYSGLVYYSQSFNSGETWSKPSRLTTDTSSFDQRYFDMALLPDGEAAIIWLDNRKQWQKEGSALFYAVTNGKEGFQNERLISGPCCQCCRTDLFIDRNKNIHVMYRAIINDSIRDMVHIVSADGGKSFASPQRISADDWVISGCPHTGPAMAETKKGLHFTWFTGGNDAGIYYNNSQDNGKTFSARKMVSGKASKHCQITSVANGNILIVWNESFQNGNSFNNRIGLEERDVAGNTRVKHYLTSETSNSSFPVIYSINANKAIIAYTEHIDNKNMVMYKLSETSLPQKRD